MVFDNKPIKTRDEIYMRKYYEFNLMQGNIKNYEILPSLLKLKLFYS